MLHLNLEKSFSGAPVILSLGSHSDDIEIGCGGTILRLAAQYPDCLFHWVVFSAIGIRETEARQAAALFTSPNGPKSLSLHRFQDGFMPFVGADIKVVFEELKRTINPDVILTHHREDAHQDHRLVAELTWNTFRDHFILEYEIPKYDGDMGRPNVFVPLDSDVCEQKVRYLIDSFESQRSKRWFRAETFFGLMRLRGMECNAPSGYAEGFYCKKLAISI